MYLISDHKKKKTKRFYHFLINHANNYSFIRCKIKIFTNLALFNFSKI